MPLRILHDSVTSYAEIILRAGGGRVSSGMSQSILTDCTAPGTNLAFGTGCRRPVPVVSQSSCNLCRPGSLAVITFILLGSGCRTCRCLVGIRNFLYVLVSTRSCFSPFQEKRHTKKSTQQRKNCALQQDLHGSFVHGDFLLAEKNKTIKTFLSPIDSI